MKKNLASLLAIKQKFSLINQLFSMDYDDFRGHLLCTYAKFSKRLRTANFSENFAHARSE